MTTTPAPPTLEPDQIDERTYRLLLTVIAAVAILLRAVWPVADQPWQIPLGINWHDEGAWTHNARNMALFGVWETDQWNPMYLAPVFNAFEYLSFSLFGVGLWQARLVSEALGVASVLFVAGAVRLAAGRTAGVAAAALMATNFVWVMWNRAALLETSMIAPMTAALYAYARAERSSHGRAMAWGILASGCALSQETSAARSVESVDRDPGSSTRPGATFGAENAQIEGPDAEIDLVEIIREKEQHIRRANHQDGQQSGFPEGAPGDVQPKFLVASFEFA